jgi:hypothetical protein
VGEIVDFTRVSVKRLSLTLKMCHKFEWLI